MAKYGDPYSEFVLVKCNRYTEERGKLIDKLQKNGGGHLTLTELLNPVGDHSLLIQFQKMPCLIQRI